VLHAAIQTYRDLLTDALAADSQARMDEHHHRRSLFFGDRPLCTVLRPRFLTPQQYRFLQDRVRALLPAFSKIHRFALADQPFRAQFWLTPQEETLFISEPRFRSYAPTSRFDAFFVSEQELFFTEYNAETPAGAAYNDALTELFLGLPIMGEFMRRYTVRPIPARPGIMHGMLDAFREFRSSSELPRIAILDWREVPTYSEFLLWQEYLRGQGLSCIIADPREVEYKDGKLFAQGQHITLIYKRVLISEVIHRCGLDSPTVRAVRDGAVCMVNPFRCKPLYKKASLAVLSDERNRHLFSREELEAINGHIPWTRRMEERKAEHGGRQIDLLPWVLQNRERLVLKPNDDYGGKGIVLGWTVDGAAWEQAVRTALRNPYIVQQRVTLPTEPYPSFVDGKVVWIDRMFDTAPFVRNGEFMDACLTRISTSDLLNVTAGGGSTVPTLLVEKR
jgi:hypothetical protein